MSGSTGSSASEEAVYSFRLLEALRQGDHKTLRPFLSKAESVPKEAPVKELSSLLHVAVRCAEYPTLQFCLDHAKLDINASDEQNGNTPLHLAASLGRSDVVELLLSCPSIDDTKRNRDGKEPLECAQTPQVAQLIQVSRAQLNQQFMQTLGIWESKTPGAEGKMYELLESPRVGAIDLNVQSRTTGSTLLHEAVARKDTKMIETAIRRGADVYARNRKGKSALDACKDEKIKALLRQFSNADAAIAAQNVPGLPPTFRGYLAKWTNLAGGYKTRWFVLQDGILSYYHSQEEEGKSSRGSVNLRFAKVRADGNDKHRFEIISEATAKGSSKLYLRGSHPVERARWVQVLQQTQDHFGLSRTVSRTESIRAGSTSIELGPNVSATASSTGLSNVPSRVGTPAIGRTSTSTNNALLSAQPLTAASTTAAAGSLGAPLASVSSHQDPALARTPSLISKESYRSDREDSDGQADSEALFDAAGKPRIIHSETFPLISNALKLKIELAHQLASALPTRSRVPAPLSSSSSASPAEAGDDIKMALKDALSQIEALNNQHTMLVGEREQYLLRRYEQEIQVKRMWEENIKALAQQHADVEAQLQEAAAENARKRKALKEARGSLSPTLSPPVASPVAGAHGTPSVVSPAPRRGGVDLEGTIADRRPAAEPMRIPALAAGAAAAAGIASGAAYQSLDGRESAEEGEDEFFDAVESGNLPNLKVETPIAQPPHEDNWPDNFNKDMVGEMALEPYRKLRTSLPIGKDERPSVSLWAILKNNIGKDLTKISFPVSFNEPTSMLQRMAEDMEFSECLDAAATQRESSLRIAFVAAFAMSNYSSTIGRIAKPFNPMLGETFEYMRPDKHYRYISEQVSHHPPVSACVAQSPLWDYLGCVDAKSKFLGRTFEIRPTGVAHVNLKIPPEWLSTEDAKRAPAAGPLYKNSVLEHFTWNKVTTSVSGFIVGSPTIDHVGDLTVTNHVTGEKCTLTFKPRGWRGGNAREISGHVWDAHGNVAWDIAGRWDSQLVARRVGAGTGVLDPDQRIQGDFTSDPKPSAEYVLLWRNSDKPSNTPFNLTPFAITLNDLPASLPKWLPPTDCRVRPDLVSFEEGRFDEANGLKQSLEDYQRQTRRKREAGELPPHEPRWFTKTTDAHTGETLWKPKMVELPADKNGPARSNVEYWTTREEAGSTGKDDVWQSEHIYGPFESKRIKG
ncbi:unnamed protein product [Parajaminaea phylloscopi]